MKRENILKPVWLKATVLGSLWASSEIILGSFLHNLKIPFAGTILSAIGIILLVAGSQNWNEKGIIWRAGIICALMKTLSPSADIFGPMISIAAEAFLLEASVRIFGKNIIGYLIGGAAAVSWSLFNKIINLILIYGPNIIDLYKSLYEFSIKQLDFPHLSPWSVIFLLFILYIILGAAASLIGIRIGKNRISLDYKVETEFTASESKYNFTPKNINQKFSFIWLVLHLVIIILGLISFSIFPLWIPTFFVSVYVSSCIIKYKQNLNRLKNIKFWVSLILIMVLSGILLSELKTGGTGNYLPGFLIGLEMNVRAFLMIFGFSSISIELRNPEIENWFKKKGMSQFSISLEAAFKILPFMIANISEEKELLKKPFYTISKLISKTDVWLEKIENQFNYELKIFFLTGKKGSGKTTFILRILTLLQEQGLKVGGIIAPGFWNNNIRSKFDIIDISSNERKLLCGSDVDKGKASIGRFNFTKEGLELGNKALSYERVLGKDIVVVDEVGPLELAGNGWANGINELILKYNKILILVVRDEIIENVKNYFDIENPQIINIENNSIEAAAARIINSGSKLETNLAVNI